MRPTDDTFPCPSCGYNLAGVPRNRAVWVCPECGKTCDVFAYCGETSRLLVAAGSIPFVLLASVPALVLATPRAWYPDRLFPWLVAYLAISLVAFAWPMALAELAGGGTSDPRRNARTSLALNAAALILAIAAFGWSLVLAIGN